MELDWYECEYNEKAVKEFIEEKGGVYLIVLRQEDRSRKVRYIGKAEKLRTRLLEHFSEEEPNKCLSNYAKGNYEKYMIWVYIPLEEDRKNIEYTLYKKYTPKCNEKEPEGKIVDISFPKI